MRATAETGHATYLATRHFGSLDGLRFLCISAVIWHHTLGSADLIDRSILFVRGHVGVDFFFVLSGFLITTLLLREEAAKGRFSLRGFYWRRALRILPVYYLVVGLAAFNEIVLKGQTESLSLVPYYIFFLSNFLTEHIGFLDPTWSLSVEEQYYLIWPALLLLLPRRWIPALLLALIGLHLLVFLGVFDRLGITAIPAGPLLIGLGDATEAILMGSLAALVLNSPTGFARLAPLFRPRAMPWLCLGLLILALAAFPGALRGWPNLLVHGLMTATLISLVVREDNGMAGLLKLRPIVRIGQVSYGIYLYHLFAHGVMLAVFTRFGLTGPGLFFFSYYALTFVIAEISFRSFEAWFQNLRHKPLRRVAAG
ncbi:acyltransferase family protein [Sedimentitalea sp. HM32M-2]|uniref:acyltransferase family protein n=1 Tax=Sedimentitalea sp. HM32M-2 TaxID=3351566 RepID=UPI00363D836A